MPRMPHLGKKNMSSFKLLIAILCYTFFTYSHLHADTKSIRFELKSNYGNGKFEVHFDPKDEYMARRVVDIANKSLIKVVEYFKYMPVAPIHFNILSEPKISNGNARVFPTNIINLYNFPANNNEHLIILEDWWRGLILHEFTHVVHLEQKNGFYRDLEKVFGSIVNLPLGVVPRWFAEGIATWSESTFLNSGRLQNEFLNKALWTYLKNPENCTEIDCMDFPKTYPKGQLSYWFGAHFLNYLEGKKTGTIKCLVEANSSRFPFNLDDVFFSCTGEDIIYSFDSFKAFYLKRYSETKGLDEIVSVLDATLFEKGWALDKEYFYRVEKNRWREEIVGIDLVDKVGISNSFNDPISEIVASFNISENERGLLVSFYSDPYFNLSKKWKVLDAETLTLNYDLNLDFDPSYLYPLGGDEFISMSYLRDHWNYKRFKYKDGKVNKLIEGNLDKTINLNTLKLIKNHLILKITDSITEESCLIQTNLNLELFKKLYCRKGLFSIIGKTQNALVLKSENSWLELDLSEGVKLYEISPNFNQTVTFLEENESKRVSLYDKIIVEAPMKMDRVKELNIELADYKINVAENNEKPSVENYPRLSHYSPHYWFISAGIGENLSNLGAFSSIEDPLSVHRLSFAGNYYFTQKDLGRNIDYTFTKSSFILNLDWLKEFFVSSNNTNIVNEKDQFNGSLQYKKELGRFQFIPGLVTGSETIHDFISDRSSKYFGAKGAINYQGNVPSEYIQNAYVYSRYVKDTPDQGESYDNWQSQIYSLIQASDKFQFDFKYSYGKLFKENFYSGVLYGGGVNSVLEKRFFESYGLDYGNAYGNKIQTVRFKVYANLFEYYRGSKLAPLNLQEVHGVMGVENLKTDVIKTDDKFYRNASVDTYFFGAKAKTIFLYYLPVEIEGILSSTIFPDNERAYAAKLVISAGAF